SPAD
ncbi:hypothetical protein TIFTF001_042127, partial [Ficus carica]